jgi:hypothetical protein
MERAFRFNKLILLLASCLLGVFLVFIAAEFIFFLEYGGFYYKKSISNLPQKSQYKKIDGIDLINPLQARLWRIKLNPGEFKKINSGLYEYSMDLKNRPYDFITEITTIFFCIKNDTSQVQLKMVCIFNNNKEDISYSYFPGTEENSRLDRDTFVYAASKNPVDARKIKALKLIIKADNLDIIKEVIFLAKEAIPRPPWNSANRLYRQPINFKKGKKVRIICVGESTTTE